MIIWSWLIKFVCMENKIWRMEKLEMKKVRCQAKVVGTLVTVGGAILMTLYKGNVISFFWSHHNYLHSTTSSNYYSFESTYQDWVKGSILLLFANLAWALFFILQVQIQTLFLVKVLKLSCLFYFNSFFNSR